MQELLSDLCLQTFCNISATRVNLHRFTNLVCIQRMLRVLDTKEIIIFFGKTMIVKELANGTIWVSCIYLIFSLLHGGGDNVSDLRLK